MQGSLEIVQAPLLALLQQCSALLDQHAASPAVLAQVLRPLSACNVRAQHEASTGRPAWLRQVLTALQYIVQIFYSLSSQDIPEFFEDNLKEFMARPPGATPHRSCARPHRALRCGCGHRALGTMAYLAQAHAVRCMPRACVSL